MRSIVWTVAIAGVVASASTASAQYGFHGLGTLPDFKSSYGYGVSADGTTAAMTLSSIQGVYRAARWTMSNR